MTDRETLIEQVQQYLKDTYNTTEWDKNCEYEYISDILRYVDGVDFFWERQQDRYFGDYYAITYCSKIGKTITLDNDADRGWDTLEEFADWIVDTNKKIKELEDRLPQLKVAISAGELLFVAVQTDL